MVKSDRKARRIQSVKHFSAFGLLLFIVLTSAMGLAIQLQLATRAAAQTQFYVQLGGQHPATVEMRFASHNGVGMGSCSPAQADQSNVAFFNAPIVCSGNDYQGIVLTAPFTVGKYSLVGWRVVGQHGNVQNVDCNRTDPQTKSACFFDVRSSGLGGGITVEADYSLPAPPPPPPPPPPTPPTPPPNPPTPPPKPVTPPPSPKPPVSAGTTHPPASTGQTISPSNSSGGTDTSQTTETPSDIGISQIEGVPSDTSDKGPSTSTKQVQTRGTNNVFLYLAIALSLAVIAAGSYLIFILIRSRRRQHAAEAYVKSHYIDTSAAPKPVRIQAAQPAMGQASPEHHHGGERGGIENFKPTEAHVPTESKHSSPAPNPINTPSLSHLEQAEARLEEQQD